MNTENFDPIQDLDLKKIFELQKQIKFLYEPSAQKVFEDFDLSTYEDQETFKRYCWRIVEELTEALEDQKNKEHFLEELIDGFNFLIELHLLVGKTVDDVPDTIQLDMQRGIDSMVLSVIYQLGITANVLKNRQWRRSQYLVDLYVFDKRFNKLWPLYMNIFFSLGLTIQDIWALWSKKYQVNLFRIKSNY